VRPAAFTPDDIACYRQSWSRPGALTAMLNYYRAAARRWPPAVRRSWTRIDAPVLVIWGQHDRFLRPQLAMPSPRWVPQARIVRLSDASHWVPADRPQRVNALLLKFMGDARP
jgi:pimeloyl-ACP methyl ester carboxylesterase